MNYTLDITTEMIKQVFKRWILAENLKKGTYILSGSGRYSLDDGRNWYKYNDGDYFYYSQGMHVAWGSGTALGQGYNVKPLFNGNETAKLELFDGGWVMLYSATTWSSGVGLLSDNLQYRLSSESLEYSLTINPQTLKTGDTVNITSCSSPAGGYVYVLDPSGKETFKADIPANGCRTDSYTVLDTPMGIYTVRIADYNNVTKVERTYTVGEGQPSPVIPVIVPVLPPFPGDPGCTLPTLSWNFIDVMKGLSEWVVCHINHIITILGWFKDVIVAAFDYMMQFMLYFVSLKWLTDFIAKFFDALDTWLSAKFGIEKEKPFLDELLKKFMSWLLFFLDNAAENEKKNR